MTIEDHLIDKRVVQRNIRNGKVDAAQFEQLLRTLPDLSDSVWRSEGAGSAVAASNEDGAAHASAGRVEAAAASQLQSLPG